MSEQTIDLHGHERQPFPNFQEDATYLEAVTVTTESEAVKLLRAEGIDTDPPLARVWMRYGPAATRSEKDAASWVQDPADPAWFECDEDLPGAVPFWKDGDPRA